MEVWDFGLSASAKRVSVELFNDSTKVDLYDHVRNADYQAAHNVVQVLHEKAPYLPVSSLLFAV
jgi:hypothetical protein